jgi:hypothetical protein
LQSFSRILGGAINVVMRSQFTRKLFFILTASDGNGVEAHTASELECQMTEAPDALNRNQISGAEAGIPKSVLHSRSCTH